MARSIEEAGWKKVVTPRTFSPEDKKGISTANLNAQKSNMRLELDSKGNAYLIIANTDRRDTDTDLMGLDIHDNTNTVSMRKLATYDYVEAKPIAGGTSRPHFRISEPNALAILADAGVDFPYASAFKSQEKAQERV